MKKFLVVLCAAVLCAGNAFAQAASDDQTVDCGTSVTIIAAPAAGFHFVKWVNSDD